MRRRVAAWGIVVLAIGLLKVGGSRPTEGAEVAVPGARSPIVQFDVVPTRIVWRSEKGVGNAESLLVTQAPQPLLAAPLPPRTLTASDDGPAGVLLDFGRELQGHVELYTPLAPTKDPLRVRFGESASEAMADLGAKNAQNHHAIRATRVTLPWLGERPDVVPLSPRPRGVDHRVGNDQAPRRAPARQASVGGGHLSNAPRRAFRAP